MANDQNTGTPWTDQEVEELKKLAQQNTPTPLIANKLGRSEVAIHNKAQAEKISLQPANRSPYG